MKKGVEDKLAQGVIVLACIALMILVNLIPGINFFTEENVLFLGLFQVLFWRSRLEGS